MTLRHSLMTSCRGDTIIEVILALTIFSLVTVITITMMNLGIANAENALEVTTARNELNAQAEALRFIHSSYISKKLYQPTMILRNPKSMLAKSINNMPNFGIQLLVMLLTHSTPPILASLTLLAPLMIKILLIPFLILMDVREFMKTPLAVRY